MVAGIHATADLIGPIFLALMLVIAVSPMQQALCGRGVPAWLDTVVTRVLLYAGLLRHQFRDPDDHSAQADERPDRADGDGENGTPPPARQAASRGVSELPIAPSTKNAIRAAGGGVPPG
jgi:hypothetical protein